jgi:hypothetical protein
MASWSASSQIHTSRNTQHFWTVSNKVKDRGWLNIGYNTQEVWEIQAGF